MSVRLYLSISKANDHVFLITRCFFIKLDSGHSNNSLTFSGGASETLKSRESGVKGLLGVVGVGRAALLPCLVNGLCKLKLPSDPLESLRRVGCLAQGQLTEAAGTLTTNPTCGKRLLHP